MKEEIKPQYSKIFKEFTGDLNKKITARTYESDLTTKLMAVY